jgi:hypothetical protein
VTTHAPDPDPLSVRADERITLVGTLDWFRGVVENKLSGLSVDDARRVMTESGLSPLGVVKHLAWVERGWFRETFAGERVEGLDQPEDDNSLEFALGADDTIESVAAFYRDEARRSRAIVDASSSLDSLSVEETRLRGRVSLRWLLVHMIEETARHAGHLDIMREAIDGRTGD